MAVSDFQHSLQKSFSIGMLTGRILFADVRKGMSPQLYKSWPAVNKIGRNRKYGHFYYKPELMKTRA